MTTIKFDSPVRDAIEHFAKEGGALPQLRAQPDQRPGAATAEHIGPANAEFIPYGPPQEDGSASCEILATLGEIELEYAAIRRAAAVFDAPHRGTLIIKGSERRDFLNRMLTQDLRELPTGAVADAFWLNRKGRIDADLTIAELGNEILIDLDVTNAEATAKSLDSFVFSEDVQVRDVTHELHRITLHGQNAHHVISRALGHEAFALEPMRAATLEHNGTSVSIFRKDIAGAPGLHLTMPREHAASIWKKLVTGETHISGADSAEAPGDVGRPIGWYALNIARIEAGTPIFNIDFGSTNLPHESGVVDSRVSFKKGCYIGQEIVARMQNLGKPKQTLIGLSMTSDHLPVAGGAVFEIIEDKPGDRIGVITSSTISPMCSAQPIAFAMLRTQFTEPGATVIVHAEGEEARAVSHALTFWQLDGPPS